MGVSHYYYYCYCCLQLNYSFKIIIWNIDQMLSAIIFKVYFCQDLKRLMIGVTATDLKLYLSEGSGCGSVGRAVAFDTRGQRFESSHRQKFILILNTCLLSTVHWKDENKEKEAGYGPFFKKVVLKCCHLGEGGCLHRDRSIHIEREWLKISR